MPKHEQGYVYRCNNPLCGVEVRSSQWMTNYGTCKVCETGGMRRTDGPENISLQLTHMKRLIAAARNAEEWLNTHTGTPYALYDDLHNALKPYRIIP